MVIPVVITVYQDKSFAFVTKSPPAAVLLKKAAGIATGSKTPNKEKVGQVTRQQVLEIVRIKQKDLNATSETAAFRVVAGTARSMGSKWSVRTYRGRASARWHRTEFMATKPSKRYRKRWRWWMRANRIR